MKNLNKGFTLIELLIVIALLGALAVGLLAAVDPFEQLKKGTDTSRRNTVAEFFNAGIRYYATNSAFPWAGLSASQLTNHLSDITTLQNAGELKANFANLAGGNNALAKMYLSSVTSAGSESITVCFLPESKSFQFDKNSVYDAGGVTQAAGTCKSQSGNQLCYWCIK